MLELGALPDVGMLDVLLDLAGAERLSLTSALAFWQREQDRILNRSWRRPGDFARPGGL